MPCAFISSTMFALSWSLTAKATSRQSTPLGFRAMRPRKVSYVTGRARHTASVPSATS